MYTISKDGKWKYEVNNDGTVTLITPRTKEVKEGSVTTPSEVDGYPVTSLGASCFYNCTSLKEIVIPDSVTSLGRRCFSDCTSLQSVTMLNQDIKWDKTTFEKCPDTMELHYKYW